MNSKALNAIFNGIDINQFKIISACECAKEAWEKLQTAYEGTASVRLSKLQMLATRFEDLRMEENETVSDFNSKLCDISNEAHGLGETYPEVKLVRKVLRSMPDQFAYKVTTIEEANDVDSLRLEDLIGNLQTFENKLNISKIDKERKIALQTVAATTSSVSPVPMTALEVKLTKSMSLIAKNFGKLVNMNGNPTSFERKLRSPTNKQKVRKGIRCRECRGYGHIQADEASDAETSIDFCGTCRVTGVTQDDVTCTEPSHLRITRVTQDDVTCTEPPHLRYATRYLENHRNLNTIFLPTGEEDSEDDEECSIEMIQQQLNDLLKQCHEVGDENKRLKEKVKELEEENEAFKVNLKAKIDELELENEVLEVKQDFSLKDIDNLKELLRHLRNNDCNKTRQIKKNHAPMKNVEPCLNLKCDNSPIATTLEASVSKLNRTTILPSNSGCSKHMTGVPNYLKNLHNVSGGQVTLGDGNKTFVKGEGNLDVGGLPNLDNVLYVEGLKSNLLSVSQLCDLYDSVLFTKRKCEVFDQNNRCVLSGYRSSDNCYKIDQTDQVEQCPHTTSDTTDLCCHRLGNLNFQDLTPNINAGICARYQASPKESHLSVVNRIIRYVSGTPELRKWYSKDTNNCLAGNSDADWTGDVDDRKNITGVSHDRSVLPPLSGVINVYDLIHLKDHTFIGRIMLPHMHP
ncbi:PREDICTED: uncharacterized protein LOC105974943 [Erythranthe guttata]|uniref:uncharacterized protein LOC105974943 n=1 Tax=Erythranthe guttata TaxID=4155 RepID=UPI00064D769E|nr:PREDICTED: uncharacterized protein LOC105974943 [Erythranthe guttata]|eukprot:XP_012855556.1 PREDICTED: uncharacterized protein LOC105974943 [Erythranthe guttata]